MAPHIMLSTFREGIDTDLLRNSFLDKLHHLRGFDVLFH